MHSIQQPDDSEQLEEQFEDLTLHTIRVSNISTTAESDTRDEVITYKQVQRGKTLVNIRAKIDTGVQGNTLPVRMFRRMYPDKLDASGFPRKDCVNNTHATLTASNGTRIPQYGSIQLPCRYDNGK